MPSARFIEAVLEPDSPDCAVTLVTLTHASFAAPLRFCTGGEDLTSNGLLFKGRAMDVSLPGESADRGARRGRLRIDDVSRDLIGPLRAAATKPGASIEAVLAGFPDDIEISWPGLSVEAARMQGDTVELDLALRDDSIETWPVQAFTPFRCPGLFV